MQDAFDLRLTPTSSPSPTDTNSILFSHWITWTYCTIIWYSPNPSNTYEFFILPWFTSTLHCEHIETFWLAPAFCFYYAVKMSDDSNVWLLSAGYAFMTQIISLRCLTSIICITLRQNINSTFQRYPDCTVNCQMGYGYVYARKEISYWISLWRLYHSTVLISHRADW